MFRELSAARDDDQEAKFTRRKQSERKFYLCVIKATERCREIAAQQREGPQIQEESKLGHLDRRTEEAVATAEVRQGVCERQVA